MVALCKVDTDGIEAACSGPRQSGQRSTLPGRHSDLRRPALRLMSRRSTGRQPTVHRLHTTSTFREGARRVKRSRIACSTRAERREVMTGTQCESWVIGIAGIYSASIAKAVSSRIGQAINDSKQSMTRSRHRVPVASRQGGPRHQRATASPRAHAASGVRSELRTPAPAHRSSLESDRRVAA